VKPTTISSLGEFEAERDSWDDLYRSDPHAQLFLSWRWLHAYLPQVEHPWTICLLREGERLVAALPLITRDVPHRLFPVARELRFACDPFADYEGMLCRPGSEHGVSQAFAEMLADLPWNTAVFTDVSDARFVQILAPLRSRGIVVAEQEPARCLAIELPHDYDSFLKGLSKPTRRRTTTPLKSLYAQLSALRITQSDEAGADLEAHVDAIIHLNTTRWSASARRAERLKALLHGTHASGALRVHAIWDGDRPIAAGAILRDPIHRVYAFYLVAHDRAYDQFGPGKAILALVVQTAIAERYATVDFMRGDDDYKRSYATRERENRSYVLTRPSLRSSMLSALAPMLGALRHVALRLREEST
jgi:CelD/BcsL family acetyltransferase involved in cellulose biosynthesis